MKERMLGEDGIKSDIRVNVEMNESVIKILKKYNLPLATLAEMILKNEEEKEKLKNLTKLRYENDLS